VLKSLASGQFAGGKKGRRLAETFSNWTCKSDELLLIALGHPGNISKFEVHNHMLCHNLPRGKFLAIY